jgi:hypothetical protein
MNKELEKSLSINVVVSIILLLPALLLMLADFGLFLILGLFPVIIFFILSTLGTSFIFSRNKFLNKLIFVLAPLAFVVIAILSYFFLDSEYRLDLIGAVIALVYAFISLVIEFFIYSYLKK